MFFFKQKTAYEILRDWSSDVCSSDLESQGRSRLRLGRLLFPVPGRRGGFERGEQSLRDPRDVFDRGVECRLVGLGRLVESAHLPHVLQGCGPYLLIGRRWVEVE